MTESQWRCRALIDVNAWQHNLQQIKSRHQNSQVMAVIKADAYGHGLANAVHAFDGMADAFAVATLEEALSIKNIRSNARICVLSQCWDKSQLQICQQHEIEVVIWNNQQLKWLAQALQAPCLKIWLKVDTGMGRLGFLPAECSQAIENIKALKHISLCGVMTHFANADDMQDDYTNSQIECFKTLGLANDIPVSLANSAAALGPAYLESLRSIQADYTWIRPGIMLTGTSPFSNDIRRDTLNQIISLKPVMTLEARLLGVRHLKAGSPIGYGGHYITPYDMPIGIVSIGYGDGYPRGVNDKHACVMLHGKRVPIIGRISMDSLCIDLRDIDNATTGDIVTLWGASLPIEEVAFWADTISYELMCQLTPRVKRVIINQKAG